MGKTTRIISVSMGEPQLLFIHRMIDSSRYGSVSEVVRQALRLMEQQEARDETERRITYLHSDAGGQTQDP